MPVNKTTCSTLKLSQAIRECNLLQEVKSTTYQRLYCEKQVFPVAEITFICRDLYRYGSRVSLTGLCELESRIAFNH